MGQAGTDDDKVKRAFALVLMREVLPILDAIDEPLAGAHLQAAIDALLRKNATATMPN